MKIYVISAFNFESHTIYLAFKDKNAADALKEELNALGSLWFEEKQMLNPFAGKLNAFVDIENWEKEREKSAYAIRHKIMALSKGNEFATYYQVDEIDLI